MKVSVCIPAYNAADWLAGAIESALAQTEPDLEVVVWDDGSTDGTLDVVLDYAARDSRVRFGGTEKNMGVEDAFNSAVSISRGEYIVLLGSDDRLKPDYVAKTVPLLADASVGMVSAYVDTFGAPYTGYRLPKNLPRQALREVFYLGNYLYGGWVMRRSVFDELGGFTKGYEYMCDLEMLVRLVGKYEIRVVEEPLYRYHIRIGSISNPVKQDDKRHAALVLKIRKAHYRWRSVDGQLRKVA